MKLSILLPLIFFCSALPLAGAPDYSINVHVTESRMVREPQSAGGMQRIKVVIDGKKLELESESIPNALLSLGDYKARIVREDHWRGAPYETYRVYEFLFSDNKTRRYILVGEFE